MHIDSEEQLREIYGSPKGRAKDKQLPCLYSGDSIPNSTSRLSSRFLNAKLSTRLLFHMLHKSFRS